MNHSTISVIIPVYNGERYLRECIDSILNQTFKDIEVILMDDGSTDGSGAICEEYASIYCNVKVFHQTNKGINATRKAGVQYATGEWIAFCDDDDSMPNDALELMFAQTEGTDIVIGFPENPIHRTPLTLEDCRQSILGESKFPSCPWAKLIRRVLLTDEVFDFPREIDGEEDAIMNTRLLFKINRAPQFVFKKVYNFRRNQLSVSHTKKASLDHEYAFYKAQSESIPNGEMDKYLNSILRYKLNGLISIAYNTPKDLSSKHPHLIQIQQEIKQSKFKLSLQDWLILNVKNTTVLRCIAFCVLVKRSLTYRLGLNN